jgi:hypothetical protein
MQKQEVFSAGQGLVWFRSAWELIRRQPLRLLMMGLLLQLIAGFSQVSVFGFLFVLAMPAFTAGMLQGLLMADHGQRPGMFTLFAPFSWTQQLPTLLMLGAISILVAILTVGFVLAGSLSGLDPALLQRIEAGDADAVAELDPEILTRSMVAMVTALMLGACLSFFAIPLAWFQRASLGTSIIQGIVSLFRQWKALLVLGLLMGILAMPLGLMAGTLITSQLTGSEPSTIAVLVLMILVVGYQLMVFATQYMAYRDVFGMERPQQPGDRPAGDDDQLVA